MSPIEYAIWVAVKLAQTALIVRLARTRLLGQFPAFAAYLSLSIFSSIVLFASGGTYSTGWIWLTPAILLALAATVLETHWKIQHHCRPLKHPNTATSLMAGVSALICWFTLEAHAWTSHLKPAFFGTRYVTGVLAIWMLWHTAWFPRIDPPLPSNLLNHGRILAVFLCIQVGIFAAINLLAPYAPRELLSCLNMGGQALCFCVWIVSLRREK